MTRWTLVSLTRKARRARGKERANTMGKGRVLGKASRVKKRSEEHAETVARQDTNSANVGRKAAGPRNKRTMSERRRKLVT